MRVEQKQFLNLQEFIIDIIGEFSIKDKISVIFRPATYPIFSTFGKFDSIYKATREILIVVGFFMCESNNTLVFPDTEYHNYKIKSIKI